MDIVATQDKLSKNIQPGYFDEYLNKRSEIINALTTTRYKKRIPMPESQRQPYFESGNCLVDFMVRYAKVAMAINPIILEYNNIYKNTYDNHPTDLAQLHEIASKLITTYNNTEFKELRKQVGVLKLKKHIWLKVDVEYRNTLYRNLLQASRILEETIKMKNRKKRLDAKVSYPYWLW